MPKVIKAAWQTLFGNSEPATPVAPTPQIDYFQPTFEQPIGYGPNNRAVPMNPAYFATADTANYLMTRFGATAVIEKVAPGNQGPLYTCSQQERWLVFSDGTQVNAGTLASLFAQNPEKDFPGVAQNYALQYIAIARQAQHGGPPLAAS